MAEAEKGDSSTGKAKGKTSLLDDDISKDFMTSWKSMSMTGGDDMDFDFGPVTKGNKKSFDFGKMDMDFSLDGDFGKMSSFKINMPDLDFSNSPKKSTKSKEKSEDAESSKGNRCAKHDDFNFSFGFNGLDDFSLDSSSTKGGRDPIRDKGSKKHSSTEDVLCEDMPKLAVNDNGAAEENVSNKPSVSKDAANSKSDDLMDGEEKHDESPNKCLSNSTMAVDMIQPKGTHISSDKNVADNDLETNLSCHREEIAPPKKSYNHGTTHDLDPVLEISPSKSISSPASAKSAEKHMSWDTEVTLSAQTTDEETHLIEKMTTPKQSYGKLKVKDLPATSLLVKMPTQSTVSEEREACSMEGTQNDRSEAWTVTERIPAVAVLAQNNVKRTSNELSSQFSTEKSNRSNEKNEIGGIDTSVSDRLTLDDADSSGTGILETFSSDARPKTEIQQSALKDSRPPFHSVSTVAKPMLMTYKVPRADNSKFNMKQDMKECGRINFSMLEKNRKGSTRSAAESRSEQIAKKFDDNRSSSATESANEYPIPVNTEKNAEADTVSRKGDTNVIEKFRNGNSGQASTEGLFLPSVEKQTKDVKSSSFQSPQSVPPGRVTKFSNPELGNLKDKISNMVSAQKSKVSEVNKSLSLGTPKKLPGLPSINISSRNITMKKHSASPIVKENLRSLGNAKEGARLQVMAKMDPPVNSEKQRPSTSLLKRKPSEAAHVGLTKLHPPKRPSPSVTSISRELSSREVEDEVHIQGKLLEGSTENVAAEYPSPKYNFHQDVNIEDLGFTLMVESDANVEKADSCAKELDDMSYMLRKMHEEAKELLVRVLVNNNNLLMLNHPIYQKKISAVQKFADRLMSKPLGAGASL